MTHYREFMRRKLLEEMYDKLTPEEKLTYVQLTMQDKDHREIMEALERQGTALESIKRRQNWYVDFGSDVAANFFTDSLIWLGSKLIKRIR